MSFVSVSEEEESELPPIGRIVYDQARIARAVAKLAAEISRDYAGKDLVVAGVLKGAELFTCDLVRQLTVPVTLDFISLNAYWPAPRGGRIEVLQDLVEDVHNRHLLLIEDIIDTGLTLNYLLKRLRTRRPASLKVCTLLNRPDLRLADISIGYSGFEVKEEFLVGYGLDFRDHFRHLPYIATISDRSSALTQTV